MKVLLLIAAWLLPTISSAQLGPSVFKSIEQAGFDLLVDNHLEGSGVIVHPAGFALIAGHAAQPKSKILEARSPRLGRLVLKRVAMDLGHDLALVQLPPRSQAYPFRPVARDPLAPGETVYLYASPLYRHGVLIRGAVGSTKPTYEYLPDVGYYVRIVHVAASSPPGTSGGPWLNGKGEVVGLQSGLMHESGAPVGLAYMSPRLALRRIVQTKKNAQTMSIRAGLEEFWEQSREFRSAYRSDQEGIVLVKLDPAGAAAKSGLKDGDVVTHVGKTPVAYRNELLSRIRRIRPGRGLTVVVTRQRSGSRVLNIKPVVLEKND
ncbi:MAG: trypsin-like peptidase domain-containing protein [Myxococcota bacterium]|nr:trypsin-like peptidase domain-containing protein [Myxococcota bacterium]